MKLLFASDSFKGTLSSEKTAQLLTKAAKDVFGQCECIGLSVADGGEGTLEAVISALNGEKLSVCVHDPLMKKREAFYGVLDEERAMIEMSAASGLTLVSQEKQNPLKTTSYGTGELIKSALKAGYKEITIAIGGSATNDGGMGCMKALGVRFLDEDGCDLDGIGENLNRLAHIDCSGMIPEIKEASFTVMCDVTNPLCGENGATYNFGAQKGGSPEALDELERGMCLYRDVIIKEFGVNPDEIAGAGAAGGLGGALAVFLGAKMKSGIEVVLDLIDFDSYLEGVSLVVTGEGRLDGQSCYGKVVKGVGMRCKKHGIPAVALVGSMGEGAELIYDFGIASIMTTVNAVRELREILEEAEELYYDAAVRMFSLVKLGMEKVLVKY